MKSDSPHKIMQELSAQVVKEMEGRSLASFESALEEMTQFHKFLLEAYNFQENGNTISFAELEDGFQSVHENWTRQYIRILEIAAEFIGKENDYIETVSRLHLDILPRSYRGMPDKIVRRILGLPCFLIHRVEEWRESRLVVSGERSIAFVPVTRVLSSPDAKAYADALSHMINSWESTLSYVEYFYEWKDAEKVGHEILWQRLSKSWFFLFRHLENTAYMLAAAVLHNDRQGALDFSSSMLKWRETISLLFDRNIWHLNDEIILPDMVKNNWQETKAILERQAQSPYPIDFTPKAVFEKLTYSAHSDMLIVLSGILMGWYLNKKTDTAMKPNGGDDKYQFVKNVKSGLPLEVCLGLLSGTFFSSDDDDDGIYSTKTKFDFSSFLISVLKLISVSEYVAPTHNNYLDSAVSQIDGLSERRVILGRVFTPSTKHRIDDLLGAWIIIALEMYSRNPSQKDQFVSALQSLLNTRNLPDQIKILKRLKRAFIEFGDVLQSFDVAVISQMEQDIELIMQQNKADLQKILEEGGKLTDEKIDSVIEQSPVDPEKIKVFAQVISEDFIAETPKRLVPFESVAFSQNEKLFTAIETKVRGISKSAFTTPALEDAIPPIRFFTDPIIHRLRAYLFHDIIETAPKSHILCKNVEDLWRAVRDKASEIRASGLSPILFGDKWLHELRQEFDGGDFPEEFYGFTYKKEKVVRGNFYWGTLDDVDVYVVTGSSLVNQNGLLLFPSNVLQEITFSLVEDKSIVKITDSPSVGKARELEFLLSTFAEFQWRSGHIYRLSVAPEALKKDEVKKP